MVTAGAANVITAFEGSFEQLVRRVAKSIDFGLYPNVKKMMILNHREPPSQGTAVPETVLRNEKYSIVSVLKMHSAEGSYIQNPRAKNHLLMLS